METKFPKMPNGYYYNLDLIGQAPIMTTKVKLFRTTFRKYYANSTIIKVMQFIADNELELNNITTNYSMEVIERNYTQNQLTLNNRISIERLDNGVSNTVKNEHKITLFIQNHNIRSLKNAFEEENWTECAPYKSAILNSLKDSEDFKDVKIEVYQKENCLYLLTNKFANNIAYAMITILFCELKKEITLTKACKDVLQTFITQNIEPWENAVSTYLKNYDPNIAEFKKNAKNLYSIDYNSKIENLKLQINKKYNDIQTHQRYIEANTQAITQLNLEINGYLYGLTTTTKDNSEKCTELLQFLTTNNAIKTFGLYTNDAHNQLELFIETKLAFFDEIGAKTYFKSSQALKKSQKITKVFEHVFITKDVEMYLCSPVTLNLITNNVRRSTNKIRIPSSNAMPNPHLYFYDCWGSNGVEIKKLLAERKILEAVALSIATIAHINIHDGAVISNFISALKNNTNYYTKALKYKGTFYNIDELYTILQKEASENGDEVQN